MGKFFCLKLLSKNTVTWLSIWYNGELVVAQTSFKNKLEVKYSDSIWGHRNYLLDKLFCDKVNSICLDAIKSIDY